MESKAPQMTVTSEHKILCVALVLGLFLGVGVFDHSIWAPTEPTVSGIVWNMYHNGNLAVPMINDTPYFEKPPLYYWMALVACRLFESLHPGVIRLPSALMGLVILALLYQLVKRRHGEAAGLLAVLFGATSLSFYEIAHRASTDMAALFMVCCCFAAWLSPLASTKTTAGQNDWRTDLLLALLLSLSFYAKNFYTYLIVLPPILLWLCGSKAWGRITRLLALVVVFSGLFILPWAWELYRSGGWEYLRIVFVDNTLGRFFDLQEAAARYGTPLNDAYLAEKQPSPFFYLVPILQLTLPWTIILAMAVIQLFQRAPLPANPYRRFLRIAIITIPVVLTLSSSKVVEYILPVFFIFILALMDYLAQRMAHPETGGKVDKACIVANFALFMLALLAAPMVLTKLMRFGWFLLWLVPCLLAVFWLARNIKSPFTFRFLFHALALAALACVALISALFPWLDDHKTDRYFFNLVKFELKDRDLYTTLYNDRRLPLLNYYVDRRLKVDLRPKAALRLLTSGNPCGVFLSIEDYRALQPEFAAIPHEFVYTDHGRGFFCFVATPRKVQRLPAETQVPAE